MDFQSLLKKVEDSSEFKEFKKKNPKAYFCSGFFTIDVADGKDNQRHIDFYVPSDKDIYSFKADSESGEVEKARMEMTSDIVPEPVSEKVDFDLKSVEELILEAMEKNAVRNKLQKIMISLQSLKGKPMLVCTVFISMMGILRVHISISGKEPKVELFEKKNLFDLVRKK